MFDSNGEQPEKKLLILDLDETLIHGSEEAQDDSFQVGSFSVVERPYVRSFMAWCREHFTVAIWTTATEDYTRLILQTICGTDYPFEFIWCRDRCTLKGQGDDGELRWLKDLKKVRKKGWNLEQVLMLEDTPQNLARHYGNVIPIHPFTGDQDDVELEQIMSFLLELKDVDNVRCIEKRGWRRRLV